MAYDSYKSGELKDGYTLTDFTHSDFGAVDAISGYRDGVQIGDITGTISNGLEARVRNGRVYFRAVNEMNMVHTQAAIYFLFNSV